MIYRGYLKRQNVETYYKNVCLIMTVYIYIFFFRYTLYLLTEDCRKA